MSDRPRHLTHVVHRRNGPPNRRPRGDGPNLKAALAVAGLALAAVILAGFSLALGSRPANAPTEAAATPVEAAATLEPAQPTSTFLAPSPTPTKIAAAGGRPAPTQAYTTITGDTLPAIAARFGVNPDDIQRPAGLSPLNTLNPGQRLTIPNVLDPAQLSPAGKLIPDSELVFSAAAAGFDAAQFARQQGGYLAGYQGFVDGQTRAGGDVVLAVAQDHSLNPRLLMALLEYQSGWVTQPQPQGKALTQPLGNRDTSRDPLTSQLTWAASQLAIGYYGWRAGTLTELTFPDGATLRLNPSLNAGSVAVQYFFAELYPRPQWEAAVGADGFLAAYRRLFGDPYARELPTLIPGDLTQPPLTLPFMRGATWYFSGGPHGAWENGGAQAALDFAPASLESGCAKSDAWVTASAAGYIVRADHNAVLLDLDGDQRETTGWVLFYFHIADQDRVKAGTFVEPGDFIGHPSCEGGRATGTHVHLARKYNGEWIPAAGPAPFNLEGWIAQAGEGEYLGTLERAGQVVKACTCTAAFTALTAGR